MNKRDVYLQDKQLEEALEEYFAYFESSGFFEHKKKEKVNVEAAVGRITADPIFAISSSPHYHAAAMDGVAVSASDTFGAQESTPKRLMIGKEAVFVDTGDPLPAEKDAVVMIEDVHFVQKNEFEIISAAVPGQHIRAIGEDIVASEMILPSNHVIRPVDQGALLAGGVTEVSVYSKPAVGIIPTGDELVEPGAELEPGNIVEYNSQVLGSMIFEWGGIPLRYDITADEYEEIKEAVKKALKECDVILINAGSSAGRKDYTAAVIRELGNIFTHGVAIKPGKPTILGEARGTPVLGIPGYPVSAILAVQLFVKPLIYRRLGQHEEKKGIIPAVISKKIASTVGSEDFVRVKLGQVGSKTMATPVSRGAGIIMSMVRADGILRIPSFSEGFDAGQKVNVELLTSKEKICKTAVIIGSHDMSLDIIDDFLKRISPAASLSSAHVGSLGGLKAIKNGEAHCAGIHLLDEDTGEYNISYIERFLPNTPVVLVNLVYREQGLLVNRGNPLNINGIEDIAEKRLRFVNRQRGAGTRVLFDYVLKTMNIASEGIIGYEHEEYTHTSVAAAVSSGTADAGMGIKAAAKALNLDFVPVAEERYDLCIPEEHFNTSQMKRVLEVLKDNEFREKIVSMGGYKLHDCGTIIARLG